MKFRLIFLTSLLLIVNSAIAQWHFTASIVSYNADCGDGFYAIQASVQVSIYNELVEQLSRDTYNSQELCESVRRTCSINYSNSGCYIRTTTTPCQGNTSAGGFYGEPSQHDGLGIGGEYFSQNETYRVENGMRENELLVQNEVLNKNWYNAVGAKTGDKEYDNQYIRQIQQLNKRNDINTDNDYNLKPRPKIDPDKTLYVRLFDAPSLDDDIFRYGGEPNPENLNKYLSLANNLTDSYLSDTRYLEQILQKEFERVSGYNIKDILNKHSDLRTEEEKQILYDYGAFKTSKLGEMYNDTKEIIASIDNSPEKKAIDAAILAYNVYGDDKEGFINQTNFNKIDLKTLSTSDNPLKYVADLIDRCNNIDGTGFHAEIYHNEITDTYVISIEGSNDLDDWVLNNARNAADTDVPQYILAKQIGDVINSIPQSEREKLNLEIVGHSLGGGVASVIGLTTGADTKTFNAARVPNSFLEKNGLLEKVTNNDVQNISAYHTSTDILTQTQEFFDTPATGTSVNVGNPATLTEKFVAVGVSIAAGAAVGPVGAAAGIAGEMAAGHRMSPIEMAAGHRMSPIVRSMIENINEKKKAEWDKNKSALEKLQKEIRHAEMWKQ